MRLRVGGPQFSRWAESILEILSTTASLLIIGIGAMLVTLPVLLPVFELYDVSLIWFGVLLVKLLEIGMITPPVGMNIFVIRGVAGQYASLVEIFKGVTLFLIADLVVVALVIFYPGIVMFMFDS
jgi:TRAP-type C4-dicarboxylate transport system permease large subunit